MPSQVGPFDGKCIGLYTPATDGWNPELNPGSVLAGVEHPSSSQRLEWNNWGKQVAPVTYYMYDFGQVP